MPEVAETQSQILILSLPLPPPAARAPSSSLMDRSFSRGLCSLLPLPHRYLIWGNFNHVCLPMFSASRQIIFNGRSGGGKKMVANLGWRFYRQLWIFRLRAGFATNCKSPWLNELRGKQKDGPTQGSRWELKRPSAFHLPTIPSTRIGGQLLHPRSHPF